MPLPAQNTPSVIFWVEHDDEGAYLTYATELAEAWKSLASVEIWLEAGDTTPQTNTDVPLKRVGKFNDALRQTIRAARPNILVAIGISAARSARRAGAKAFVYIALDDWLYNDDTLIHVVRNYSVLRPILRASTKVVVPTEGCRYQFLLREWTPEDKLYLLPPPIDVQDGKAQELFRALLADGKEA